MVTHNQGSNVSNLKFQCIIAHFRVNNVILVLKSLLLCQKKCICREFYWTTLLKRNLQLKHIEWRPISDANRTWKNIPSWWVNCFETVKSVRNDPEAKTNSYGTQCPCFFSCYNQFNLFRILHKFVQGWMVTKL